MTFLFSKFCFDESRKWDKVEDHVDEEESRGEDEGDSKVEPAIHEHVQLLTLIAVLLLQVVSPINVPKKGNIKNTL